MTISEQIKILCVRCNVSKVELARRLGKSPLDRQIMLSDIQHYGI